MCRGMYEIEKKNVFLKIDFFIEYFVVIDRKE